MASTIPWERVRQAGSKLTTPLPPDDYLRLINPLWSQRELRGRIEKVVEETEDAATLVIRPGWGWRFDAAVEGLGSSRKWQAVAGRWWRWWRWWWWWWC